ncbi:hypothetical protein EV424DRAFT_1375781 [Suillus variegatus]|nr:hypothetical protein EV424DRAFT_1375781 [Suillus variegatus]
MVLSTIQLFTTISPCTQTAVILQAYRIPGRSVAFKMEHSTWRSKLIVQICSTFYLTLALAEHYDGVTPINIFMCTRGLLASSSDSLIFHSPLGTPSPCYAHCVIEA